MIKYTLDAEQVKSGNLVPTMGQFCGSESSTCSMKGTVGSDSNFILSEEESKFPDDDLHRKSHARPR